MLAFPSAADAASVTVQSDSGTRSFQLDGLRQDVNQEYTVSSTTGDQRVPVRGTSLNGLFEIAKPDVFGVRSYEISGGGRTVVLAPDQLTGGGQGSPVLYAENGQAVFLRPRYAADDLNGNDRLVATSLRIRVLKRPTLKVTAKVSDAAVRAGQRITFTAAGTGAAAGRKLNYNWTFNDNTRRQPGSRVTHAFREAGTYAVLVSVTTADDRTGASDVVRVRVGAPPKGPDRKGGGTDSDASAPDSGTAAGADSGTSGGSGTAATGPDRSPAASPPSRRARRPAPAPAGRTVEGTLLSDAATAPPRVRARQRAARTGNDREDGGGSQVPGAAVGILVALGLAGTGALVELRTIVPWPWRRA